jgi:hypothetical protein
MSFLNWIQYGLNFYERAPTASCVPLHQTSPRAMAAWQTRIKCGVEAKAKKVLHVLPQLDSIWTKFL